MSRPKTSTVNPQQKSDATFVSRWSRLKHESARLPETEADVDTTVLSSTNMAATGQADATSPGKHQQNSGAGEAVLTDKDMPDIETLTPESDYTDFLSPGVSEGLRKLALRKLFLSEVFNIRDGLDEYDGDYTHFEKLGDTVTADMRHQFELEAQRKAEQSLQHDDPLHDDTCVNDVGINSRNGSLDQNESSAASAAATHTRIDESPGPSVDESGHAYPASDNVHAAGPETEAVPEDRNSPEQ